MLEEKISSLFQNSQRNGWQNAISLEDFLLVAVADDRVHLDAFRTVLDLRYVMLHLNRVLGRDRTNQRVYCVRDCKWSN